MLTQKESETVLAHAVTTDSTAFVDQQQRRTFSSSFHQQTLLQLQQQQMAFHPESVLHNPILDISDESKKAKVEDLIKTRLREGTVVCC